VIAATHRWFVDPGIVYSLALIWGATTAPCTSAPSSHVGEGGGNGSACLSIGLACKELLGAKCRRRGGGSQQHKWHASANKANKHLTSIPPPPPPSLHPSSSSHVHHLICTCSSAAFFYRLATQIRRQTNAFLRCKKGYHAFCISRTPPPSLPFLLAPSSPPSPPCDRGISWEQRHHPPRVDPCLYRALCLSKALPVPGLWAMTSALHSLNPHLS
jgi:hypothetical protein